MNKTEQLKKQHDSIFKLIEETRHLVHDQHFEEHASAIAKNISVLAGIISMHLSHEDQYLYPSLLKSEKQEVKVKAKKYMDEMGNLKKQYADFKNLYNTKNKILTNPNDFVSNFDIVFKAIERRIVKEDNDLYLII